MQNALVHIFADMVCVCACNLQRILCIITIIT